MLTSPLALMPGWQEWLVIGAVVLLIFGPRRLPEIAEAFGKSINRFKKATREVEDEVKREIESSRGEPRDDAAPGGDDGVTGSSSTAGRDDH